MQTLVDYLRTHVPLTQEIDIGAGAQNSHWLELSAPLHPNLNDKQTAFGGSLATLCTLSGWCITSMLCRAITPKIDIAVIDSHIRYLLPVTTDPITARAFFPSIEDQSNFIELLQDKSRAKLSIKVEVNENDHTAVNFEARYYVKLI